MHIGRHIRARRRALNLTQEELARELSVSPQNISAIETEHSVPSLELLVGLHRVLGVSTDYLLTGRDPAPVDISGAVRSQPNLSPAAKRSIILIINELSNRSADS